MVQAARNEQQDVQPTKVSYDTCGYTRVANGVNLFYRQSGDRSREPIIFLHGNRDNHTHYTELQSILAPQWNTVALDLRGHGFSSKIDCPLTVDLFAEDLAAFITAHGWDKVTLVGHSLGAVTSMVYTLKHLERVSHLVLMGVAAYYEMKWQRPPEVSEEVYQEVLKETNKRAAPFFFLKDEAPEIKQRVEESWTSIPFSVHKNLINLVRPDLRPYVADLKVPTLVLTGDKDISKPAGSAEWLAEHIPGARFAVIRHAAHFLHLEHPVEVAEHIQQFL